MSVSLHLEANSTPTQALLMPLLLPATQAVLMQRSSWLHIYAEQLSADLSDIEELAVPLSQVAPVYCVLIERQTEVYIFDKGALQHITQTLPTGILSEDLLEFDTAVSLVRTGVLEGILLAPEPEKPGLAEFFGRSVDE
ncbi:MAG: hypothetical protein ACK41E_01005 [Deinococcales bacterium]